MFAGSCRLKSRNQQHPAAMPSSLLRTGVRESRSNGPITCSRRLSDEWASRVQSPRGENMHTGETVSVAARFMTNKIRARIQPIHFRRVVLVPMTAIAFGWACSLLGCSKVTTVAEAQKPARLSVSYIGAWGVKGDGPGQLDQPRCIATDAVGNAYLADSGSQYINKFTGTGTPLLSFQEPNLKHPQSITIDSGGAVLLK